jgi:glycosyltransferase involved in cell wall biosynthesis
MCTLVIFPSYYEGFGIPVLEAMAAHRPLIVSDIPVFRELTEGRGTYFPPDDSEAMAAVIAEVLSCKERQQGIVDYGDQRVRAFTFSELASQVEHVYRRLVAQNRTQSILARKRHPEL